MYFDDEDDGLFNPDVFHLVHRELYALSSNLDISAFGLRSVPTHTEDGIPIRKLYVSNLPPKTTRTELFGVFAQYGFIKSCWLRMGEKGPTKSPTPTYAFVTFTNPADAHKALLAPLHELTLRGRNLRISPADSWHQPYEDADGKVNWKPNCRREEGSNTQAWVTEEQTGNTADIPETLETENETNSENEVPEAESNEPFNIMDILNRDCLTHVLSYVPIRDLIRSERVSKQWQSMVQEYLQGIRMFKTSWWQHVPVTLTTAVLRRVLQRLGGMLLRLHIDHYWSALNDRTAHTVGKFCPMLEELKVVGMHTKNWNPLIYGCKHLKSLSFVSCNKLTDSSLVHLVKNNSCLESLAVANNTHVTGLFLTGSNPTKLSSLAFYNCYSLQGTVLSAAIDTLPTLTTLKLDVAPITMWKIVPLILKKLPKLEELSVSEYVSMEQCLTPVGSEAFCSALSGLTELKILNLSRNIYITDLVLKTISQSCQKLESLNISSCNSRKTSPSGVSNEGIMVICSGCPLLERLDLSYLGHLTDTGAHALTKLTRLSCLTVRGSPILTSEPIVAILKACSLLEEIDLCGCDNVTEAVISAGVEAVRRVPRLLTLYLASTAAAVIDRSQKDHERHKLLTVNLYEDRSNPQFRPDFVDHIFEDSSDGSIEDLLYDHEDFNDFLGPDFSDDELFLDDDLEDYEGVIQFHGPNILLL